jgi:hypothetical protein
MNSMSVKIAYNELGLLLNEKNLFYWNRLNDDGKNQLIQDLNKQFKRDGIVPSVTELNITLRFMLNISYAAYMDH